MRREARLPGMVIGDRFFEVPLVPGDPASGSIRVFAREVRAPDEGPRPKPYLVFLQGGPGCEAPRPPANAAWLKRALRDYRVLLLDQRGTGRSTRADARSLARLGSPEEQARYLTHFRADAIVADCEHIRRELCGDEPWSVLGQSFGGFCAVRYLSAAPAGLREVFITGGLPPLQATAEDVYRRTYVRLREKNARYYDRYPGDVERVRDVMRHLLEREERMPDGSRLTARRVQHLGLLFGMSDGFETVHYLVEDPYVSGPDGIEIGHHFKKGVENALVFQTNPLFAVIHEACYAQGAATRWSAERVRAEFPEFALDPAREGPVLFTGEMIYPSMFDDYPNLAPLKAAAGILAEHEWPPLYDASILAKNEIPCAAAVYHDDMYVDRELSLDTASRIRGLRVWITNEYEHNGLRAHGDKVLSRLIDMVRGRV